MVPSDYFIPSGPTTNICFDCQRACGGCSWSELDPETDKPRFEPVPGWTAEKTKLNRGEPNGSRPFMETYHITACPLFVPDDPARQANNNGGFYYDWK